MSLGLVVARETELSDCTVPSIKLGKELWCDVVFSKLVLCYLVSVKGTLLAPFH